jgi:hypothetical protein
MIMIFRSCVLLWSNMIGGYNINENNTYDGID